VSVLVSGLEGIKEPIKVQLITTGVVNMDGGNIQTFSVKPGGVLAGGTFTMDREITASQTGAFSVTANMVLPPA
jgi:hypothetical protein